MINLLKRLEKLEMQVSDDVLLANDVWTVVYDFLEGKPVQAAAVQEIITRVRAASEHKPSAYLSYWLGLCKKILASDHGSSH